MKSKKIGLIGTLILAISLLATLYGNSYAAIELETDSVDSVNASAPVDVPASAQQEATEATVLSSSPYNCRFGVALGEPGQGGWIDTVNAGWYVTFSTTRDPDAGGAEFANIVRIHQNRTSTGGYLNGYSTIPSLGTLITKVQSRPGSMWLLGNEPDRSGNQDDTYPGVYAQAYHDLYYAIKTVDPTAQVGIAGLVQATPGRLQYYEKVMEKYQIKFNASIPVDFWNAHIYTLPERTTGGQPNSIASVALGTDIALGTFESGGSASRCQNPDDNIFCFAEHDNMKIFKNQIYQLRSWMRDNGLRNVPLIVSEYSILLPYYDANSQCKEDEFGNCFDQQRVSQFMTKTVNFFESATNSGYGYPADNNKLVQKWLWFAVNNNGVGHASNLITDNYVNRPSGDTSVLTTVGQTYRNLAAQSSTTPNLSIDHTVSQSGLGNQVTIGVRIRNNGNSHVQTTYKVSFYADAAMTQLIGDIWVPAGQPYGCAMNTYDATITWTPPSGGAHRYWVRIDSSGLIGEVSESDNTSSGTVVSNANRILLPILRD